MVRASLPWLGMPPLLLAVAAFTGLVALPGGAPGLARAAALAAGLLLAVGAAEAGGRSRRAVVIAMLVAAALTVAAAPGVGAHAPRERWPAGDLDFEGTVVGTTGTATEPVTIVQPSALRVRDVNATAAPRHVRAAGTPTLCVEGASMLPGLTVRGRGTARPSERYENPSPHPPWVSHRPRCLRVVDARLDAQREAPDGAWIARGRHRVREHLRRTLAPHRADLAAALVLGDPPGEHAGTDAVRAAGLQHVLAVSGWHVSAVLVVLMGLVRVAIGRLRWAERLDTHAVLGAFTVPLAALVGEFCGGSPSAWRAAAASMVLGGLRAAGRPVAPLRALALACLAMVVVAPTVVATPAFALSFVATAAVLTAPAPESRGILADLRWAWVLSLRASVGTLPVALWCFGSTPWVGVLANVAVLPVASVGLMPAAFAHALSAVCGDTIARGTAWWFGAMADLFWSAAAPFAAAPAIAIPPPSVPQGLAIAVGCGALLFLPRHRRGPWFAAAAGALLVAEAALWTSEQPVGRLRMTFLDVGQGDAALVDLPDGRLMVIDAGMGLADGRGMGERVIAPLLRARRRKRVDVLVLTHGHPDHYGGAWALGAAFPIGEVWAASQGAKEHPTGAYATLLRWLSARGARVLDESQLCHRPRDFGGARVTAVAPCPKFDAGYDLNDNSLVLRVSYAGRTIVLAGDAEAHAEGLLASALTGAQVDLLKVAHHGSRTSSTAPLLRSLAPSIAIVSAGEVNRFGHPHAEVLTRLAAHGARVLRTDRHGGCEIEWSGAGPPHVACANRQATTAR